jgi:DNA-binding SARP family transcriptional activator
VLDLKVSRVDLDEAIAWAKAALNPESGAVPSAPPYPVGRDLLSGWQEDWLTEPREEFRLLELCALEAVASRLATHNRLGLAATLARTATRLDPLRESAARTLIEIHMREGNTASALREFHRIQRVVHDETGAHLGPSLTALVASLGAQSFTPRIGRRIAQI